MKGLKMEKSTKTIITKKEPSTKKMILDAWKSGEALKAPYKLAKTVVNTAIQPIKTRMAQNKMIHDYVDTKVEKDMRKWDPMER